MADGGPGKLAMAILGAREAPEEAMESSEEDGAAEESAEGVAMDSAAGELISAVQTGDRKAVVAAFDAMMRARMGKGDTTD